MNNTSMTPMQLKRRAVRLWSVPYASKAANRHNQRAWLRAVNLLGGKWLLAKQVERRDVPQN